MIIKISSKSSKGDWHKTNNKCQSHTKANRQDKFGKIDRQQRNLLKHLILGIMLLLLPLTNIALAEEIVISGTIIGVWGDPQQNSGKQPIQKFSLIDDTGTVIPLAIDQKSLSSLGGMRGIQRKQVQVSGSWVSTPPAPNSVSSPPVFEISSIKVIKKNLTELAAPLIGSQPWVTVLCRFNDTLAITPYPVPWFETLMGGTSPGMNHYWQELSYGNINLNGSVVVGWYDLPDPHSAYLQADGSFNLSKAADDCANAADVDVFFPSFTGVNFMFNGALDCCSAWGGAAWISADGGAVYSSTWMPPWGYETHGVLSQEMGHGFGLPHSSGPYSTPYDSNWDSMSNGFGSASSPNIDPDYGIIGVHTVSYHKDSLNWIPVAQRYDAQPNTSQTITLERLGQPTNSIDYLMAKIPIGGSTTQFYTVEARRTSGGYDVNIPGDAVIIHKVDTTLTDRNAQVVDTTLDNNPNDAGAMWTVGETFTDVANGISVSIDADTGTGYVVTVTVIPLTYCPGATQTPSFLFQDDLENTASGNWVNTVVTGVNHWSGGAGSPDIYHPGNPDSGLYSFLGKDHNSIGDSSVEMTSDIALPGDAYMRFQGDFDMETAYDGGVVEYSADGGVTWLDAGGLIDAGQGYTSTLNTGFSNPLGGRSAFTGSSGGYAGSRVNLGALAGQNVRFRFRVGTDSSAATVGWSVDDVEIYQCVLHTSLPVLNPVGDKSVVEGSTLTFNISAYDPDGGPPPLLAAYAIGVLPPLASFLDNRDGTGTFNLPTGPGDVAVSPYTINFRATDAVDATLMATETINITVTAQTDTDGDGVFDDVDNCTNVANPDQTDSNADGYGNRCDADLNNDGVVSFGDYGILRLNFGSTTFPDADLNNDGVVSFGDYGILRLSFGSAPGPSALAP